jgi:2-oxoisovalerate dehydrogenase E2 component (dihydrolipoyl transacylase)
LSLTSSAELTSPFAGVLKTINKANGELTKVGQTLCEIEVESEGDEPVAETEASREEEETVTPVEVAKEELGSEPAGIQAAEEIQAEVETDLLNPIDSAMSSSGAGQFSIPSSSSATASSSSRTAQDVTKVTFGRSRKAMWKGMGKMGAVPHFGYVSRDTNDD